MRDIVEDVLWRHGVLTTDEEPPARPVACNSALAIFPQGAVLDSFSHFPHINIQLVHKYRV
jgi:hypothetical protein